MHDTELEVKSKLPGRFMTCAFFGIFLLVGVFAGYFMVIKPVMKMWISANWVQAPCVVESSRVVLHSDSDGSTYSIEVIYHYQYQGTAYTGNKYDFIGGSSSGHASKAEIVRNYPPRKKTFCYVNPENPDEAVLSRKFRSDLWFGLIPGVFVLIGFGGIVGTLRYAKTKKVHVYEQPLMSETNYEPDRTGETVLQPVSTPLKTFFGTTLGAVLLNGLVSIFVYHAVKSWNTDSVEWFLSFFMIPFVLVGLIMIFLVFHSLLQLFNPKPVLKFLPASPALGERVSLSWEIPDYRSIHKLEIKLEGREEAKYISGDSTNTAKNLFELISVVNTNEPLEISAGNVTFNMPRESMHSFDAENNKIIWQLKLRGHKSLFSDLSYEYAINVLPCGGKRSL